MYNEQIEQLISAALADGVLTEKEKQILFKKAQGMGIDLDEFEMVLDARLVELKKAEKEKAEKSAPKSNKLGDVKKCPACGAIVQSYIGKCPECGYAFEGLESNLSMSKLQTDIDKLLKAGGGILDDPQKQRQRINNTISNFPVPSTKADLFEFISALQTKTCGKYRRAYCTKLAECISKAEILFSNDPQFIALCKKAKKNIIKGKIKTLCVYFGSFALVFLLVFWIAVGSSNRRAVTIPRVCQRKVEKAIEKGDYTKATKLIRCFVGGKYDTKEYPIGDCYESVISLERELLKNGQYDDAVEVYNIYLDKITGDSNERYYKQKVVAPFNQYNK